MPGSLGPAPFDMWVIADPAGGLAPIVSTPTCLLPMIGDRIWFWFRLYRHYESGNLYRAGGIMNQPNKYLEVMETIRGALNG